MFQLLRQHVNNTPALCVTASGVIIELLKRSSWLPLQQPISDSPCQFLTMH